MDDYSTFDPGMVDPGLSGSGLDSGSVTDPLGMDPGQLLGFGAFGVFFVLAFIAVLAIVIVKVVRTRNPALVAPIRATLIVTGAGAMPQDTTWTISPGFGAGTGAGIGEPGVNTGFGAVAMNHGASAWGDTHVVGVIEAPGRPATPVSRKVNARVSSWPVPGTRLPVLAEAQDLTRFKILWDEVPTGRAVRAEAEARAAALAADLNSRDAVETTGPPSDAPAASDVPSTPGPVDRRSDDGSDEAPWGSPQP